MAQFTFADEDDSTASPAPPPSAKPTTAPTSASTTPDASDALTTAVAPPAQPTEAAPAGGSGGFTFALEDDPAPAAPKAPTRMSAAPPTPPKAPAAATPADAAGEPGAQVLAPKAPATHAQAQPPRAASSPANAAGSAPAPRSGANPIPPPPGFAPSQSAPRTPVPAAPQPPQAPRTSPAAPTSASAAAPAQNAPANTLAGAAPNSAQAQKQEPNPVQQQARAAAQKPDQGASVGMEHGTIPNVAGVRAPSPPQPNPVSNPSQPSQATAASAAPRVAPPTPPSPPAKVGARPTPVAASAAPPVVHAATPGMATITPDVVLQPAGFDWRRQLANLDPVLAWVFRVSGIVAALSLAYILFALLGGAAGKMEAFNDPATVGKAMQFSRDIKTVSVVLHWSLIITAITVLLIAFDVAWVGPTLAGLGVLLHFVAPIALKTIGQTPATANVMVTLRSTGLFLLVLGLAKYSVDFFRWLQEIPNRVKARADVGSPHKAEAKQQRLAQSANVFSPCWSLPFCREVIRQQCPAFLARKRCWKFGRGCYCDEEMIGRIIRGESLEKIKAPTRMSTQKPPCGRCHIFLEHQTLKYKMLAPLAVPATVGLMYGGWPLFSMVFTGIFSRLDALWASMSFDVKRPEAFQVRPDVMPTATAVTELSPERTQYYALWIFGILLGFFVLIYISKAIEWAVLKMKW